MYDPSTYRCLSGPFIHAPGVIAAAVARHKSDPDDVWPLKILSAWDLPFKAVQKVLNGDYHVEGDVVVVEA